MATQKSSAEFVGTSVLISPRNTMIYRPSTLKSVPFEPGPFLSLISI